MSSLDLATLFSFATLFQGRGDAWFDSINTRAVRRPPSLMHFKAHLLGAAEIGTYPVLDDSSCRWGCIDIDTDDLEAAVNVGQVWRFFGVTPWIERSRSKGYHVWVLCQSWCPATVVRDAGLYVAHIAELDGVEVNPKGDAPWRTATGLINTVRLPYSGRAQPGRMVMLGLSLENLPLPYFVSQAMRQRASLAQLRVIAARRRAQERSQEWKVSSAIEQVQALHGTGGSNQEAALVLAGQRAVTQGERDNQFYTMAKLLHGQGTEYDLALRMIERAYREQVTDTTGFSLEDALGKVRRVYGQ